MCQIRSDSFSYGPVCCRTPHLLVRALSASPTAPARGSAAARPTGAAGPGQPHESRTPNVTLVAKKNAWRSQVERSNFGIVIWTFLIIVDR